MVSHIEHPQHLVVDCKERSLDVLGDVAIELFLLCCLAAKDERTEVPDVLCLHTKLIKISIKY